MKITKTNNFLIKTLCSISLLLLLLTPHFAFAEQANNAGSSASSEITIYQEQTNNKTIVSKESPKTGDDTSLLCFIFGIVGVSSGVLAVIAKGGENYENS